jgi:hypothetical protein
MLAYLAESIHKQLIATVHLWITGTYLNPPDDDSEGEASQEIPKRYVAWIYPQDINWGLGGHKLLKGKRIRVEFTLEDDPS